MNRSTAFIDEIDQVWNSPIPESVMDRAKRSLLDYLSVTCAGTAFQKNKLEEYFNFLPAEKGAYKAIGTGKELPLKEAVFLNGLNSHALDYDDGTNSGIIHLGAPVFSLLIPLSQINDIRVEEMLRATIIGYESSYTMAVSIQPEHKARGYHATGTCGTIGATIAASYLLGFTEQERFRAFARACVAASGMLKALDDGSELKPYNVAKAALLSLTSLQLGKAGFQGHPDPLGGRGFFKMMVGKEDLELKPTLLNGTYAIMKSYTKPYASCRYTHPAVEAAIRLRDKIKTEDIQTIVIRTYSLAVSDHDHVEIPGSYSAKMSIPYATAAGLLYGKAGLQEFTDDAVKNKEILDLVKKVRVEADEKISAEFPGKQTAVVTITTKDETVSEQIDYPKGEPENPLTDEEFEVRYYALMKYAGIESDVCKSIYEKVCKDNVKVEEIVDAL